MAGFNEYPYRDYSGFNLDWIVEQVKKLAEDLHTFIDTSTIKYHDPINWDITTQYEANTIVRNGTSVYLSKQPVPKGVAITNTDYWFWIGETSADSAEIARKMRMTQMSPKIALLGDSAIHDMPISLFRPYFNGAQITSYYQSGDGNIGWTNLMTQINRITEAPDIVIIWCGSNDIPGTTSADFGGIIGAPDITDHSISNDPMTVVEWMKYCINYIKNAYPSAQIYNVLRPTHPNKPRSFWEYYAWVQKSIMREWAVPVIDAQELVNFSTFVTAQNTIFTDTDGQHYNNDLYARLVPKIANAIQAGAPETSDITRPTYFFAPASVINTSFARGSDVNIRHVLSWIVRHCTQPGSGTGAGTFIGKGLAHSDLGDTFASFLAFVYTAGTTKILYTNGIDFSCYVLDSTDNESEIGGLVQTYDITSDNTRAWFNFPIGDYVVRFSALETLSLPASVVTVLRVAQANVLMKIRKSYNNDTSVMGVHVELQPARNASIVKGWRRNSDAAQNWYQYTGTVIS